MQNKITDLIGNELGGLLDESAEDAYQLAAAVSIALLQ
jgi:hypothetical protein